MIRIATGMAISLALTATGCMVGPDYVEPSAPIAEQYRDPGSGSVKRETADLANWWTVFGDPALNDMVQTAYRGNPTLQSAAVRVLEAQARRGIAVGLLFPQDQAAVGAYTRNRLSDSAANFGRGVETNFNDWQLGGTASWELDIWGRYRRGVESADAEVLAAVASYDDVLVSLIGNVAAEYISIRIVQEQLAVTKANVEVQKRGLEIAETRFKGGTATDLDRMQATTLLRDTEAFIPELEAGIVQGQNRLCVLLGIPPKDLSEMLAGKLQIPGARSLKDKRQALRSLEVRLRERLNVAVAEVEHQDLWQRARLAVVSVNTDQAHLDTTLNAAVNEAERSHLVEVADVHTEVL